jgi:hypothetical protein
MDMTEMRAFQYREENGYLPDDVYIPTEEDDLSDPEQLEIIEHVMDGYRLTNERRQAERDHIRISVLEQLLTEHGIKIPEV